MIFKMNFLKKKRIWIVTILTTLITSVIAIGWRHSASTTKVALVNYPGYLSSGIILSNKDSHIKYEVFDEKQIDEYKGHDFILTFGMGLKWTEEERAKVNELLDKGLPLQVVMASTPENNIVNIDSVHAQRVMEYLDNGNRKNYQSLARYIRKYIDRKSFFVTEPDSLVEATSEVYYHLDETVSFEKRSQFEDYLRSKGFWHEGGRRVMIAGGLNDPFSGNKQNIDSLIVSLHRKGLNVYPVSSMMGRMEFLREIEPDLVLYFPHGRFMMGAGDLVVDYLRERNIPLITPITILESKEKWEKDPMGLMGGFMSQTVVMPELDGAVYPYVLSTQEKNEEGYELLKAIPNRLERLTDLVDRYLALKTKANKDKKLAIYFFKGPGQEALQAQGLETVPALYNFLKRLAYEGYNLSGLPADAEAFRKDIMLQGQVLKPYTAGAEEEFIKRAKPASVDAHTLTQWIEATLSPELQKQLKDAYGLAPGTFMSYKQGDKDYLAVARLQYGNIVLIPQPSAGLGGDSFAIAHGANMPPPYPYIGAYLWSRHAFKADAMIHFGTHGSLEFTPSKQVALSDNDWSDQLVAGLPHFYYYTIGNIGESMIAKRRSYATIVSYLTPAFSESNARGIYKDLTNAISRYYQLHEAKAKEQQSLEVKRLAMLLGVHRELRLDSARHKAYTENEIERIDNFAEEIANEKVTGKLYTTGEGYEPSRLNETVIAMASDPIAHSKAKLDILDKKVGNHILRNKRTFTTHYLSPAKAFVQSSLKGKALSRQQALSYAGISEEELTKAYDLVNPNKRMTQLMMAAMGTGKSNGKNPLNIPVIRGKKSEAKHPSWIPKIGKRPEGVAGGHTSPTSTSKREHPRGKTAQMLNDSHKQVQKEVLLQKGTPTQDERERATAIIELIEAIENIGNYRDALEQSPQRELDGLVNALNGGYLSPSSGGDAVANPKAVPTGRNLYSINAEATPSERAWSRGVQLAEQTLKQYKEKHKKYPTKVSYTFWSSEFIESEGTTIAQVLYMLGVEPIRDMFGRVSDIRLIPSDELKRPRIDVVVQTSGQFRDLAASRLALINRAIGMASSAKDNGYENFVAEGTAHTEKSLVQAGMTPKDARVLSTSRIFGGINGMYGTGIQEMITAGDKWDNRDEIAEVYLNNMGASYIGQEDWGRFTPHLFRAALAHTDVVIQPRQSNTWGALSLDHVYEFMGGLNLTVRSVTGKEPEAYFADYRNRNNARMQDLKEAIGVESRATVLNPSYVKDMMAGGASSVSRITEVVTNTYGWEVSKPEVIDDELWTELYNVYVEDSFGIGIQKRFEEVHPVALQEITAVMLETARKGMWRATPEQIKRLSSLHVDLTNRFGTTGGGMASSNRKLQDFIASKVTAEASSKYQEQIRQMNEVSGQEASKDGIVMKKDQLQTDTKPSSTPLNGWLIGGTVVVIFILLVLVLRRKRTARDTHQ